jgi:hypothetical protein
VVPWCRGARGAAVVGQAAESVEASTSRPFGTVRTSESGEEPAATLNEQSSAVLDILRSGPVRKHPALRRTSGGGSGGSSGGSGSGSGPVPSPGTGAGKRRSSNNGGANGSDRNHRPRAQGGGGGDGHVKRAPRSRIEHAPSSDAAPVTSAGLMSLPSNFLPGLLKTHRLPEGGHLQPIVGTTVGNSPHILGGHASKVHPQ